MYPGLSPLVRVRAPLGPDLIDYLSRIARYNGRPNGATDWRLDLHAGVVSKWRKRFAQEGLGGLADRKRAGRPRVL